MIRMRQLSLFSFTCHSLLQPPNLTRSLLCTSTSSSFPDFLPTYLETTCGFSPEKAAETLKLLSRVKSPDQPESVFAFFKSLGFDDSHVRKLLQANPGLLARGAEKSCAPKVRILNGTGISGINLVNVIKSYTHILDYNIERNFVPKFELWRRLIGSDKLLMKCLKDSRWMFSYSLEKLLKNHSFLQECGLSYHQISLILSKHVF